MQHSDAAQAQKTKLAGCRRDAASGHGTTTTATTFDKTTDISTGHTGQVGGFPVRQPSACNPWRPRHVLPALDNCTDRTEESDGAWTPVICRSTGSQAYGIGPFFPASSPGKAWPRPGSTGLNVCLGEAILATLRSCQMPVFVEAFQAYQSIGEAATCWWILSPPTQEERLHRL